MFACVADRLLNCFTADSVFLGFRMTGFDFVVLCLATTQTIEIWHHGEIFRGARECLRTCSNDFVAYLSQCMFCFSLWVAAALVWTLMSTDIAIVFITPLAVARVANLINDVFHAFCRTPREDSTEPFETKEPDADL